MESNQKQEIFVPEVSRLTQEPARTPIQAISPEETLTLAAAQAKALMSVAKPINIQGKQYLGISDWQILGTYNGVSVGTSDAIPVEVHGLQGFKATAKVYDRAGTVVGSAEAYCMKEGQWKSRELFSLASMAQTRAAAKALRLKFSYIVQLAGYEGTPAEEMIEKVEVQGGKAVEVGGDAGADIEYGDFRSLPKELQTQVNKSSFRLIEAVGLTLGGAPGAKHRPLLWKDQPIENIGTQEYLTKHRKAATGLPDVWGLTSVKKAMDYIKGVEKYILKMSEEG